MSEAHNGRRRPAQTGWRPPPGGYQRPHAGESGGTGGPAPNPPMAQPAFGYPLEYGVQYPAPAASAEGRGYTVASFICAGIAILFLPFVVGPLGAVMGKVGLNKGDPLGKWGLITSIITSVLGTVLIVAILLTVD
jgi:hypothetical protein